MTLPSSSTIIWDCARECALKRYRKKCRDEFGSPECNTCRLYIRRYAPHADDKAIDLIMLKADSEAYDSKQTRKVRNLLFGVVCLILVFLTVVTWRMDQKYNNVSANRSVQSTSNVR